MLQINKGDLIWYTKNQNYLRNSLLPDNLLSYFEFWIFSHQEITESRDLLIESDILTFDNIYSFFDSSTITDDGVWNLFLDAFYLYLSR